MASPAQAANASAAQNSAMPHNADPQRSGRVNSTRIRRIESRKIPSLCRQPDRSRNRSLYRSATQKPIKNPGIGMTAQGTVKSIGGWPRPDTSTAIAAAQPPIANTPCSRPPKAATRALASSSSAPAAWSAYWSSAPPP
jgi:hypothetical protein